MTRAIKHTIISDEIKTAILSGVYQDKLPTVRELAKSYDTSGRTIHKALKPLSDSGLIMVNGIHGVSINAPGRRRPDSGVIGIFSPGENVPSDLLLSELNRVINNRGKKVLFMSSPDDDILTNMGLWNNSHLQGFIFIYSSFNQETAHLFKAHNLPYVVGNRIYGNDTGNWVDFDSEQIIDKIVSQLTHAGFRRIAFIWPNVNRDAQIRIQALWDKKAGEYGVQTYDDFQADSFLEEKHMEYAEQLYLQQNRPEAIICWTHRVEKLAAYWAERGWSPLIISHTKSSFPNIVTMEMPYRQLAKTIWQVMEELLSGNPVSGINKLIPVDIKINP